MSIFRVPDAYPPEIAKRLVELYAIDWFDWDIEVLIEQIEKDEKIKSLSDLNIEKVRALRCMNATSAAWERFEVFSPVVQTMNGYIPYFENHIELTPSELAIGIHCMDVLRTHEYSEEVCKYIAASLMTHHIYFSPMEELDKSAKFLKPYASKAKELFDKYKKKDPEEVELTEESNDHVQAALGYAEYLYFKDRLKYWGVKNG